MADKSHQRRASGQDLAASSPDSIRNVVLIGPGGSGKTTLVEALLAAAGAIGRAGSVRDGSTVCDFEEAEHAHERSIGLAVAPVVHRGIKINLIDTPGYADFVGELRAGLRAAECALFVVGANEGIDAATRALWRECAEVGMPRAVVVTKLDQARADYDGILEAAQQAFGDKVMPLYLPVREAEQVVGLISLLDHQYYDHHHTGTPQGTPLAESPVAALAEDEAALRGQFIEGVIEESEDETLMDRYLGGEEIAADVLTADLEKAVARATFYPVIPVCSVTGVGCWELLELAATAFPSPSEHTPTEVFTTVGASAGTLSCDPDGPLVVEIIKTTSDPYVGRLSLARVFSGTLHAESPVHVSGHLTSFFGESSGHPDHDEDERVGAISYPFGRLQTPAQAVVAGDICAIARLTRAETGDTLSAVDAPLVLRPWQLPEPLLPVAIEAASKADDDKLAQALGRVAAEDPSLRVENNPETKQLVLWCMGEAHAEVVLERMASRYGVSVGQVPFIVSLRETFSAASKGHGRHVKQSGGHGQYAVCDIEVEPLPSGSGFEFVDKVVGGAIPRQFIPAVEKGIVETMSEGGALGFPVVDVQVTCFDGKFHPVDSDEMSFKIAGRTGFRDACSRANPVILEPVSRVEIVVPSDVQGDALGDLNSRRGRVQGTEAGDDGEQVISALVPTAELLRYAIDLRSLSGGRGRFTFEHDHYEPVPGQLTDKILADAKG